MSGSARSSRKSRWPVAGNDGEMRHEMLKPNHNLWIDPPSHWRIVIRQEATPPSHKAVACPDDVADGREKRRLAGQARARICDLDDDSFWVFRQH